MNFQMKCFQENLPGSSPLGQFRTFTNSQEPRGKGVKLGRVSELYARERPSLAREDDWIYVPQCKLWLCGSF